MSDKSIKQKGITRRSLLASAAALGISHLSGLPAEAQRQNMAETPENRASSRTDMPDSGPSLNRVPSNGRNVVYIVADDLGWADVGYHAPSEIRTPNIDRLVQEGVELNRFYGCPVCSPSRASLMTGRSPMRYGMVYAVVRPWQTHGIPLEEQLLPEAFRAANYQTWMVGKWHLGHWNAKLTPNARGFDHFYGFLTGDINYFEHTREDGIDWQRNGKSIVEKGYSTDLFAQEAVTLIESRDRKRSFFLYLPFNAPHQPLMAPEDEIQQYAAIANRKRRTYAAMVTALDTAVGRIRTALENSGAAENTVIIFHGDNGGQTQQGAVNLPLRAGKSTVFEGGIRVPAFLHAPKVLPGGSRSEQVMTNLDVFPTLASATGIKPKQTDRFDGRDLWEDLQSNRIRLREDLFFAIGERGVWGHAVIRGEWKLITQQAQGNLAESRLDGPEEVLLFQIETDPFEKNNLAEEHPDVVASLKASLAAWRKLHPEGDISASSKPHPGYIAPSDWSKCSIT